jgi:hypothetical protein
VKIGAKAKLVAKGKPPASKKTTTASEVQPLSKDLTSRRLLRTNGLRARCVGFFILTQTAQNEEHFP